MAPNRELRVLRICHSYQVCHSCLLCHSLRLCDGRRGSRIPLLCDGRRDGLPFRISCGHRGRMSSPAEYCLVSIAVTKRILQESTHITAVVVLVTTVRVTLVEVHVGLCVVCGRSDMPFNEIIGRITHSQGLRNGNARAGSLDAVVPALDHLRMVLRPFMMPDLPIRTEISLQLCASSGCRCRRSITWSIVLVRDRSPGLVRSRSSSAVSTATPGSRGGDSFRTQDVGTRGSEAFGVNSLCRCLGRIVSSTMRFCGRVIHEVVHLVVRLLATDVGNAGQGHVGHRHEEDCGAYHGDVVKMYASK